VAGKESSALLHLTPVGPFRQKGSSGKILAQCKRKFNGHGLVIPDQSADPTIQLREVVFCEKSGHCRISSRVGLLAGLLQLFIRKKYSRGIGFHGTASVSFV
jgi:hypothetical protein